MYISNSIVVHRHTHTQRERVLDSLSVSSSSAPEAPSTATSLVLLGHLQVGDVAKVLQREGEREMEHGATYTHQECIKTGIHNSVSGHANCENVPV